MSPDDDSDRTMGDPNPRRDGARTSPIIEGAATEIREEPEAAANPEPLEPSPLAAALKSAGPLAIIALVLAVWALGGAAALWWRTYKAGEPDLEQRVQALSAEVTALKGQGAQAKSIDQRLDAVAVSAKAAATTAAAAQTQAAQALAATKAAQPAGADAANAGAQASKAALAAIGKRVAALERRPDPSVALQKLEAQIADLETHATKAETQAASLDRRVASLEAEAAAQAKRLVPLQALLSEPKIDVGKVEATTAQAESEARAAALIVAARALQQQIDTGKPFAPELAAVERLGADPAVLRPIQASAPLGVLTAAQLRRSFEDLTGPILAGVKPAQSGGVLDRIAEEAGRLVRIRAVGGNKGDAPVDVVGRIESALASGGVAAALKDRQALPASAQALTASWAAKAQARADAEAAAEAIRAQAVDQLGKART